MCVVTQTVFPEVELSVDHNLYIGRGSETFIYYTIAKPLYTSQFRKAYIEASRERFIYSKARLSCPYLNDTT